MKHSEMNCLVAHVGPCPGYPPNPEEIKAASHPAIQERAREMDEADEREQMELVGCLCHCHRGLNPHFEHEGCDSLAPKPDAPSEALALVERVMSGVPYAGQTYQEALTRKRIHEEWLITKAQHEAENQKLREALERAIKDLRQGAPFADVIVAQRLEEALNGK